MRSLIIVMLGNYRYKAIMFDFDGTLVDSANLKTLGFRKLYEYYGVDIADQVEPYHLQHQGVSRFVKFRYWHESLLKVSYTESMGVALSEKLDSMLFNEMCNAPYVVGALGFLKEHYKKLPLYICSSMPEETLKRIVFEWGMRKFFVEVFGVLNTKANVLRATADCFCEGPLEVLMIGDSGADFVAATLAGISFICLKNGNDLVPNSGCSFSERASYLDLRKKSKDVNVMYMSREVL